MAEQQKLAGNVDFTPENFLLIANAYAQMRDIVNWLLAKHYGKGNDLVIPIQELVETRNDVVRMQIENDIVTMTILAGVSASDLIEQQSASIN